MQHPTFINTHSFFSFRYGTLSLHEVLEEAAKRGIRALALTDINYTGSAAEFVRLAAKHDIKPVVGVDFRNGAQQVMVALARNNEGFKVLNDYLSLHLHEKRPFVPMPPPSEDIHIIYPFDQYQGHILEYNEWIGIRARDLNRLPVNRHNIPEDRLVILHTATFRNKRDYNAHRLLRAIANNTLLSKLPKSEEGHPDDRWVDKDLFALMYNRYPQAIRNTQMLLEECEIDFTFNDPSQHKNLKTYTGNYMDDNILLEQLCREGLRYRYKKPTDAIYTRLDKELQVIREKEFVSYFLINWRIVQYARQQGFFYVGRGSGANSIVAYLLRITDVDPVELDLYFERFINLYRRNPPDFDIDFSWKDREDITDFIFKEFPHVSLLGAYSTFKHNATMRELGKVFGLPSHEIERVQDVRLPDKRLDSLSQLVRRYSKYILHQPSHLSIHAGGILISQDPIHYYTATELPPKGYPTTQFDMITAEDVGLYKFDILSQRGLSKIKECIEIVKENQPGTKIDIHDIPAFKHDEEVKHILRNGNAIGCFYVESPAMRMLLRKLKVDHYLGLVAASSVIRPGVAQSGMMREYIQRFRYPERRKDAHPIMLEIMPETFGVMVYQEDVIKVAHYFAGLSLAEADVLRRGMSGKYRSRAEFHQVKDKFFTNCAAKGHTLELAREIWRQIESFAGYAFSKGHSASYAVESYQSLFLKAYYPLEYMVATINNGGGFYRWDLYLHEARMHGAEIELPCVNTSEALCIIRDITIYIGFAFIKDLEQRTVQQIILQRIKHGPYEDLADFIERTGISLEQAIIVIRINGLRFTGKTKKELLWNAHFLLSGTKPKHYQEQLFRARPKKYDLPMLDQAAYEDAFDEMELLGFPLCNPFELITYRFKEQVFARNLKHFLGKTIYTMGYLVTVKNTSTTKKKRMHFGTFLDRNGEFLDTVHFPPVAAKYPFRGRGIYLIKGKVTEEFDFCSIEVVGMQKIPFIPDPRFNEQKSVERTSVVRKS